MEVKFEECCMPLDRDSLDKLSELSNIHFLLIESEREERERNGWRKIKVSEKRIELLNYNKNVIILGHDFFYEQYHQDEKIIGYCPLTFSEEHKPLLRLV